MIPTSSATELRKMTAKELRHEIQARQMDLAKIRLGVELRHEKDTAKLRLMRRAIARLQTVLGEKPDSSPVSELKEGTKNATVPASRKRPAKVSSKRKTSKGVPKTSSTSR